MRGHCEHSGHAQSHPGGGGPSIEPEADPRYDDDQTGGYVDLNQVVAHGTNKLNLAGQTRIVAWNIKNIIKGKVTSMKKKFKC